MNRGSKQQNQNSYDNDKEEEVFDPFSFGDEQQHLEDDESLLFPTESIVDEYSIAGGSSLNSYNSSTVHTLLTSSSSHHYSLKNSNSNNSIGVRRRRRRRLGGDGMSSSSSSGGGGGVRRSRKKKLLFIKKRATTMFQNNPPFGVMIRTLEPQATAAFEMKRIDLSKLGAAAGGGAAGTEQSPSLIHAESLERMNVCCQKQLRQLAFLPGVSDNTDLSIILLRGRPNNNNNNNFQVDDDDRSSGVIDSTLSALPTTAPHFGKYRLPLRSDVGFPGATEEEVQLKQEEICTESEQEEAKPKLIILARHLIHKSMIKSLHYPVMVRHSIFAPPLGAIPSARSRCKWRPRPFMDRPSDFQYALACPWDISLNSDNAVVSQRLVGSMSLYYCTSNGAVKVSEEFMFPIGNWEGILKEESGKFIRENLFGLIEEEPFNEEFQDWTLKRKKKALFSFDSRLLNTVDSSLVVVLQVFVSSFELNSKKSKGKRNAKFSVPETFGTQFLSPLCFGVSHLATKNDLNDDSFKWPRGSMNHINLYSCSKLESQENFSKRVASLSSSSEPGSGCKKIGSKAIIFTSAVGSDFSQVLLQNAADLQDMSIQDKCPRLIIDVSGDGGILLSPEHRTTSAGVSKRSDLVRLPPCPSPAGYLDSFEAKEVLYLPPREHDKFEGEIPHVMNSYLNVIYLYPRLLLLGKNANGIDKLEKGRHYSIRIRLLRKALRSDGYRSTETSTLVLENIYNPAPGRPLLQALYTKIPSGKPAKIGDDGIYFQDEIKLMLPEVLDGSYFIHFSLYATDFSSNDLVADVLAETMLPLSNISSPSGKYQVTTVIKNGVHDVLLGKYCLKVETRLASSLHVSDAHVASLLSFSGESDVSSTRISRGNSRVIDGSYELSAMRIVKTASDLNVAHHFRALAFSQLLNLVRYVNDDDEVNKGLEMLRCFLEIIRKAKSALGAQKFNVVTKEFMDSFDEIFFYMQPASTSNSAVLMDMSMLYMDQRSSSVSVDSSIAQDPTFSKEQEEGRLKYLSIATVEALEDQLLDAAVHVVSQQLIGSGFDDVKLNRTTTFGSNRDPFVRKSYAVKPSDRMRAEAELKTNVGYLDDILDDNLDEISITASSVLRKGVDDEESITHSRPSSPNSFAGLNASLSESSNGRKSPIVAIRERVKDRIQRTTKGGIAKVAKVVVAPCVAPNLNTILGSRQQNPEDEESVKERVAPLYEAGSDDEYDENSPTAREITIAPYHKINRKKYSPDFGLSSSEMRLRGNGVRQDTSILFSFDPNMRSESLGGKQRSHSFIYESILFFWIRAWMEDTDPNFRITYDPKSAASIHTFFAHIDFLLPLCLKSLILRIATPTLAESVESSVEELSPDTILDKVHMNILTCFIDILAFGAMKQTYLREKGIALAYRTCSATVEFLTGLLSVIHPAQIASLVERYLTTLYISETNDNDMIDEDILYGHEETKTNSESSRIQATQWSSAKLHRANSSRKLRIHAVEKLASIPSFAALNYPIKYPDAPIRRRRSPASWGNQDLENSDDPHIRCPYKDGFSRLPRPHWLGELLINELFSVCLGACDIIIAEAKANGDEKVTSSLSSDELDEQKKIAVESITTLYDSLLCRQAVDQRFQGEVAQTRVTGIFAIPMIENTLAGLNYLSRMESTNEIRRAWMTCFLHICQQAPEQMIRDYLRKCCTKDDKDTIKFVKALRLSCSSFLSYLGEKGSGVAVQTKNGIKQVHEIPWLVQESFNTICAILSVIVDECSDIMLSSPENRRTLAYSVFEVLLLIISSPQSSVTMSRAIGSSVYALESFGVELYLDVLGDTLQHWMRAIISSLNSLNLSVRSVTVDFMISLLGGIFHKFGSFDNLSTIMLTVLPEAVAREIALYVTQGSVLTMDDVETCLWPLRRAIGDLEEANPEDDDRVDAQLPHVLSSFCQTMQAIIDGVLITLRLSGDKINVCGVSIKKSKSNGFGYDFDADEESLFEAATNFEAETAPMQRLRWLITLKTLHESKEQWVEAAETLLMCARTVADAIPYVANIWRPSYFSLWKDPSRSPWLKTFGIASTKVQLFMQHFLEPPSLHLMDASVAVSGSSLQLPRPTINNLCGMLTTFTRDAVEFYRKEGGTDSLAFSRVEELLKCVMDVAADHSLKLSMSQNNTTSQPIPRSVRKKMTEENATLRKMSAALNVSMTKLAEKLVSEEISSSSTSAGPTLYFVRVAFFGRKHPRFLESTSIPTYSDWGSPIIYRIPNSVMSVAVTAVQKLRNNAKYQNVSYEEKLSKALSTPFITPLLTHIESNSIVVCHKPPSDVQLSKEGKDKTFVMVTPVFMMPNLNKKSLKSRSFYSKANSGAKSLNKNSDNSGMNTLVIESTVAHDFPCSISRQRAIITSEITT